MRWIAGGIVGWLAACCHCSASISLDTQTSSIPNRCRCGRLRTHRGHFAGRVVTGLIAGRSSVARAGGATTALLAGSTAGVLYAISLVAVVMVAIRTDAAPTVVVEHPVRITGAIILSRRHTPSAYSLLVGMVMGRRRSHGISSPDTGRHALPGGKEWRGPGFCKPVMGQNPSQPARSEYPTTQSRLQGLAVVVTSETIRPDERPCGYERATKSASLHAIPPARLRRPEWKKRRKRGRLARGAALTGYRQPADHVLWRDEEYVRPWRESFFWEPLPHYPSPTEAIPRSQSSAIRRHLACWSIPAAISIAHSAALSSLRTD